MGEFVAYKRADDTMADNINASDNKAYYTKILQDALGGNFTPVNENTSSLKIGSIKLDSHLIPDEVAAERLIANEEGKYYYKWVEDGLVVTDSEGNAVLNNLDRVDVQRYSYQPGLLGSPVAEQIKFQDTSLSDEVNPDPNNNKLWGTPFSLPLNFTLNAVQDQLTVSVNNDAIALYLDTDVNTQWYKYKLDENGHYNAVNTWIPVGKYAEPNKSKETEWETYINWQSPDGGGQLRYVYYLHKYFCVLLDKKKAEGVTGLPNRYQIKAQCNKGLDKATNIFKGALAELGDTNSWADKSAKDSAKNIPASHRCFYYSTGKQNIDGFLAKVNINEKGAGRLSSGYEGRADKVSEVDYRWDIVPVKNQNTEDFFLAKLLSYIIGLNRNMFIPYVGTVIGMFNDTNYPFAAKQLIYEKQVNNNKPTITNNALLFKYSKRFQPAVSRRNEPRAPGTIGKPRTADKLQRGITENRWLRKSKKGLLLDGEERGSGTKATRENAGSVLAKALRKFDFYSEATNDYPAIKLSQLPATSFAKYVVQSDASASTQWLDDNQSNDQFLNDVNTNQEWCHLYGHGDGGLEILDNFVSGSKHCNTEQLGIETGQRRVSQNEDITEQVKNMLTWKITADQVPNDGTHAWDLAQIIKDNLRDSLYKLTIFKSVERNVLDNLITRFFDDNNGSLSLKSDHGELRNGLDQLAMEIRAAKVAYRQAAGPEAKETRAKALADLLTFQEWFLTNCFLSYPLGRRIHYRIFFDGKKCFEHHFDAQSQSFDVNEAKILDYTVERAIYLAIIDYERTKNTHLGISKKNGQMSASDYYSDLILKRAKEFSLNQNEKAFVEAIKKEIDQLIADVNNQLIDLRSLKSKLERLKADWSNPGPDISSKIINMIESIKHVFNELANNIQTGDTTMLDAEQINPLKRKADYELREIRSPAENYDFYETKVNQDEN